MKQKHDFYNVYLLFRTIEVHFMKTVPLKLHKQYTCLLVGTKQYQVQL